MSTYDQAVPVFVDLPVGATESFREHGHLLVRELLDRREVPAARRAARRLIGRSAVEAGGEAPGDQHTEGPPAGPGQYQTVVAVWQHDAVLRRLVCSPRLARVAATLLGVDAVRLYHDQLFVKPPGAPVTSWHQDQVYWPVDTSEVVGEGQIGMLRIWVALTDLPADRGGMRFVSGSHRGGPIGQVRVRHPERGRTALVDGNELVVHHDGPLRGGDATVHGGYTLHAAGANRRDRARIALAVAYVPDGARVGEPHNDVHDRNIAMWMAGRRPGQRIDGPTNPLLWSTSGPDRGGPLVALR